MVMVRPFKAIRPNEKYVDKVAALPYDTMNTEEARDMAKENEFSYLRIDRAEIDLPVDTDIHDEEVYKKASENLKMFLENEILQREKNQHLYIYREVMNGRDQIGIVGCVSVDEAVNGKIKKHEKTKPDKVEDRTKHIEYCGANTGTILLTYNNRRKIDEIILSEMNKKPIYDFKTEDKIGHTVWKIDQYTSEKIQKEFEEVDYLYIADGHHRSAAAVRYAQEKRENLKEYTGEEEFNFYLAMIVPKKDLLVMDYNRVLKDLNGYKLDDFICEVEKNFLVEKVDIRYKPTKKYEYGMYLDKSWYRLIFKEEKNLNGIVEKMDVSVLHDYLIEPILGIEVPQKDERIDFVGGIRGLEEIEKLVDNEMKIGFSLYPTSIEELIEVANNDMIMPAKSTWFEPKVRCGLFLHEI